MILRSLRESESLPYVSSMIPYGRQKIDEADVHAVIEALRSDFLTCGQRVEAFEEAFADMCGARYAVSCSNGTAALHLAMLAAGIGQNDKVVTTPITFLASANAAEYVGADVWFSDVESAAATLDATAVKENWEEGTKAIVAVDYAGHPANHERLSEVAREKGAVLIEDACHAIGGGISSGGQDYRIGSLPWVDMATFSFHPVKTMTTGEGGMVVTDNAQFAERARLYRNHGMIRSPKDFTAFGNSKLLEEVGPWAYEMEELGFNYRLTDLQCALGLSQLKKLDGFISRRAEIVGRYNELFASVEALDTPKIADWIDGNSRISWHLYQVRIDFQALGKPRSQVMAELRDKGVGTQVHYIPVSEQPYYKNKREYVLPEAWAFYDSTLSLPLYPDMSDSDIETVVAAVKEVIQ